MDSDAVLGGFIFFLMFTLTWGNDPISLIFSDGLKPPTSFIVGRVATKNYSNVMLPRCVGASLRYLEDHPRKDVSSLYPWLVNKSPKDRVVGPLPYMAFLWFVNGGDPNYWIKSWEPILLS